MKKIPCSFFIGMMAFTAGAQKFTISGTVKDAGSGENLIGQALLLLNLRSTPACMPPGSMLIINSTSRFSHAFQEDLVSPEISFKASYAQMT